MDVLSDILRVIRFSGVIDLRPEFSAPWIIETPSCSDFADTIQSETTHIVPFHIVAEGNCWVKAKPDIRQALSPGDIIIFPHGDAHILGDRLDQMPTPIADLLPAPPWKEPPIFTYGGGGTITRLVCGFLQCEQLLLHPFLKSLPRFMHIQVSSEPTAPLLKTGVQHIIQEANCIQPGSICLLTRLVELMFIEILRSYMQNSPDKQMGGVLALNDPIVGQVLNWMHADPAHPWTVSELAKQVNVSRSALATRFTELLGQPPMQYLTQWRLQLAAHHLRNTDESITKIASQVGYESEAAFNRAFKRYVGKPPGIWRHHRE
ncbi:AraC family transcriptional regulator [Fischerella thermalis]|uniref:AraC family transcriptional regulator n=1 Tax=Fischerella thermalis CCMEE 5318 TaxID=2019666 RepID=A0A2N6LI05_9CYAN|nr:AraC family transcriptional regulator [Fischerella thermalis]PMB23834.1 AraC family transcriptional regulator [Fischerella thermalis CCMEE 5318]PMB34360.1 AraC family transcriptional regulator [Fischerella thermalis CCMEE 5319]